MSSLTRCGVLKYPHLVKIYMPHAQSCNHQNHRTSEDAYDFVINHAYPVRWYETHWIPIALVAILLFPISQLQKALHINPSLSLSVLGLSVEIVGMIGDIYFTHMAMRIKPEFDKRGLEFPTAEAAWLLPDYPTLKELIFGWNTVLTVLLVWPIAFLYPLGGFAMLFGRTCAMFTNARQAKRFKKTLRLIDRKEAAPHTPVYPHQLVAL